MKIFDFLVKIAIFEAFLFQSIDLRHALLPETNARSRHTVVEIGLKNVHDYFQKSLTSKGTDIYFETVRIQRN